MIESAKNFDFFAENEDDFLRSVKVESCLVQGRHWDRPPFVTIIIPTYKRPKLLKQALESAVNQKNFDDYQIIVVDNEAADLNVETETSKLIKAYQNEKVIYYRNKKEAKHKANQCVSLVKSEWMCFLHDDDMIAENHLASLYSVLLKNKKAKYITCPFSVFHDEISDSMAKEMTAQKQFEYTVTRYPRIYACTGYYPGWLGALIHRKEYIAMGGMPGASVGVGDFCMVNKFCYKYGIYQCNSDTPFYFYRKWTGQISSSGSEVWQKCYENELIYSCYVVDKSPLLFKNSWKRVAYYRVREKMREQLFGYYNNKLSPEKILSTVGIGRLTLNEKNHKVDFFIQEYFLWIMSVYGRITRWE